MSQPAEQNPKQDISSHALCFSSVSTAEPTRESSCQKTAAQSHVYWPQLDGLRSLAFLLVFVSHLPFLPTPTLPPLVGSGIEMLNVLAHRGWIGVELFFVLSAFLITTLLLKERQTYQTVSFRMFFTRRMLRIWPLYYVFIALALLALPAFGLYSPPLGSAESTTVLREYGWLYLLFAMNFSLTTASTALFASFQAIPWSVCMEEQFYVMWGGLLSRVGKISHLSLLAGAGLVGTLFCRWWIQFHSQTYREFYYHTFAHLDPFLIGIACALLVFSGKISDQWFEKQAPWLLGLPVLTYLILSFWFPPIQSNTPVAVWLPFLSAVACGVFLLGVLFTRLGRQLFSHLLLVKLGRLTYGMYLFHLLGLKMAEQLVGYVYPRISQITDLFIVWGLYSVLGLLITWGLASLSWHLLEKRFYRLRHRFSKVPSGFAA